MGQLEMSRRVAPNGSCLEQRVSVCMIATRSARFYAGYSLWGILLVFVVVVVRLIGVVMPYHVVVRPAVRKRHRRCRKAPIYREGEGEKATQL